jgi:hypothetical protein
VFVSEAFSFMGLSSDFLARTFPLDTSSPRCLPGCLKVGLLATEKNRASVDDETFLAFPVNNARCEIETLRKVIEKPKLVRRGRSEALTRRQHRNATVRHR